MEADQILCTLDVNDLQTHLLEQASFLSQCKHALTHAVLYVVTYAFPLW